MKAGFISLGCSKNLVDTEVMLGILEANGIELVNEPEEAEVLIVNTCAFIESAKEESINTILSMAEYKKEGKCKSLIMAGCLGQRYAHDLFQELPEVDGFLGVGTWNRIMEVVEATMVGNRVVIVDDSELIYDSSIPRIPTTPKHTAYVKIAEGCNNRCSFCAIPLIRGNYRSRSIEDIEKEVQHLVAKGAREIVLIAQDTTNYGHDLYGKPSLVELLKRLCQISALKWLRILYSYPKFFNDELIELMAQEEKIVKYVDIPLQHANDEILRNMNRPDTQASVKELLAKLRQRIPGVVIRSTFIVGFPGETQEQYEDLKEFLIAEKFDHAGIFTYSQEEETVAGQMTEQLEESIKEERYHELKAIQSKISQDLNEALEGEILEVLVEGYTEEGTAYGRSYRQADEVDDKVYIEDLPEGKKGEFVQVRILQGFTEDLVGEVAQ